MKKNYLIYIVLLTLVLSLLCSCEPETNASESSNQDFSQVASTDSNSSEESGESNNVSNGNYANLGELKLRIFKIGKSDAYLFRTSSKTILIDCGDVDDSQEILDYFAEKNLTKIDVLILTHLDKKSIGGAAAIINSLEIGVIYEPDYVKHNTEYADYSSAVANKNLSPVKVNQATFFDVDDTQIKIYPCEKSYYSDDDNYSSAISVTHKESSFLFVGDAKADRIKEIVALDNIKHDFLMMPDNGILNTGTDTLLNAVSPLYAGITCSDKNPASPELLSKLSSKGINTYLTVNGSIKITSNGASITVEQ